MIEFVGYYVEFVILFVIVVVFDCLYLIEYVCWIVRGDVYKGVFVGCIGIVE